MRLAILADIHGNLPALEAVVEELERLQPDHVVVDGDLINAVPYSTEVIDFIRAQRWLVVRGNHEFYYLDFGTERAIPGCEDPDRWGQLHWLVENITPAQGQYLAMLPDDCTFFICRVRRRCALRTVCQDATARASTVHRPTPPLPPRS